MHKNLITISLFCVVFFARTTLYNAQNQTEIKHTLKKPPYLKAGDTVAIVAPSGILNERTKEISLAVSLLKSWGLHAVVGEHVFDQNHHFAGTDEARLSDFQKALNNPNIKAIWCARGGYGSVRILDKIDWTIFKEHPKWIIGYSDITAIHNEIHNQGVESIHGMLCTNMQEDLIPIAKTISTFKDAIFGNPLAYTLKGSNYNKTGTASGQLVGGNLTLLHTMLGSKSSIDTAGKILFIEEIGEYHYHIDRMLQSLKRAGYFNNCKGVIVGDMSRITKNTTPWGSSIEQLILDVLAEYNFPIAFKMPAGHENDNRAMILGRTIQLHVEKEKSVLSFD